MIRILDRLLFRTFLKLFMGFVLAAPILFVVGDLVEQIHRYSARGLTFGDIALSPAVLATVVPEPATAALLGLGILGLAAGRRERHR